MPTLRVPLAPIVVATMSTSVAEAQVQAASLLRPERAISHPFDRIRGLHELRDGRVVVMDANAQSVLLVDFSADRVRSIGRIGAGPREYRFPTGLHRLGGDSIGVIDAGNRRILVISGDGEPSGILDIHGARTTRQLRLTAQAPTDSDSRGHLYALAFSNFAPEALQPLDSAPIERWRVGSRRRDTVAYLPLLPPDERTLPPGRGSRAFTTAPQWAVGRDGQIAIVRPSPYSVEYIDSHRVRTKGKPIPYRRIRVTAAHQKRWREDYGRPRPVTTMAPNDQAPRPDVRVRRPFEPVEWPDYLPPFLYAAVQIAPDGIVWVHHTTDAGAPEHFDLVDRLGNLVGQVQTPARTHVAGFGRAHVYLVRLDADHQEFLERYPIPTLARPSRAR